MTPADELRAQIVRVLVEGAGVDFEDEAALIGACAAAERDADAVLGVVRAWCADNHDAMVQEAHDAWCSHLLKTNEPLRTVGYEERALAVAVAAALGVAGLGEGDDED